MHNANSVKDLFNEPECSNAKYKDPNQKSKCEKPEPGEVFSSCAFDGARLALLPFKDCAHIVHSPATCIGASWGFKSFGGLNNSVSNIAFTTDINLNNLVFGAESKLKDAVDYVFNKYKPNGIFIYSTCVTALIGEDIEKIAKDKEQELQIPVTAIHSPGFVGSNNFGSRVAGVTVLEKFIGKKEPEITTPYDINILGEYNLYGEMSEYQTLLEKLDIRVLGKFSNDGSLDEIMTAHRAKLNVVVNSKTLITMARKMRDRWQIPFVELSFFGKKGTSDSLRSIVQTFNDGKLAKKVEELISFEDKNLNLQLKDIKAFLQNKKAVILIDGLRIWQYLYLVFDSGIKIVATSADNLTDDDIEKAQSYIGLDTALIKNADDLSVILEKTECDILISTREYLDIAIKNKMNFLDIDSFKNISIISYAGFSNFTSELFRSLNNSVFKLIAKSAPWEIENIPTKQEDVLSDITDEDASDIKTFLFEFTYSEKDEQEMGSLQEFERLTAVEDFFDFFDIEYDEQLLRTKRYHIIKIFSNLIKNTIEIDEEKRLAFYKFILLKVYGDFLGGANPTPGEVWDIPDGGGGGCSCSTSTCATKSDCKSNAESDLAEGDKF